MRKDMGRIGCGCGRRLISARVAIRSGRSDCTMSPALNAAAMLRIAWRAMLYGHCDILATGSANAIWCSTALALLAPTNAANVCMNSRYSLSRPAPGVRAFCHPEYGPKRSTSPS